MLSLLLPFSPPPEFSPSVNSAICVTCKWWTSSRSRLLLIFLSQKSQKLILCALNIICDSKYWVLWCLYFFQYGNIKSFPLWKDCLWKYLLAVKGFSDTCVPFPALFWSYPGLQPHSTGISHSNIQSLILALIWIKAACLKKETH